MRHGMRANDLLDRLAADSRLRLTRDELGTLVTDPLDLAGTAGAQVTRIAEAVAEITATHPEAATYRPGAVL
jgi:adenylosuccinate lyase